MKTTYHSSPVVLIILAVGLVLGTWRPPIPVAAAPDQPQQPRTIMVSGQAQINVPPDEVVVTLGVVTSDKSMAASKRQNDQRLDVILTIMKGLGIDQDQIKVDYLNVGPRYYGSEDFNLRRTVVITLKDITKFDALTDAILQLEGSTLLNVDFRTSALRKYRDQARSMAVKAAREKADAMAGDLGQRVGKPISIVEDQNSWWSYYGFYNSYYSYYYGQGNGNAANAVQNVQNVQGPASNEGGATGGDSTVSPGQISVQARVSITFELSD